MASISGCWSPSFSPDGLSLAFVSNRSGVPQVWTVLADGVRPEQVTRLDDQVGRVEWSPDGRFLAFTVAPGGGMNSQIYLVRPDGQQLSRASGPAETATQSAVPGPPGTGLATPVPGGRGRQGR